MGGIPLELGRNDGPEAAALGGVRPRRRSLWALGALVVGYSLAREWGGLSSVLWLAACQGALVGVLLTRGRWCRGLLFVAAVLFAAGWFTLRLREAPAPRLDRLLETETARPGPVLVTLRGTAEETPRRVEVQTGALGRFTRTPASLVFSLRVSGVQTAAGTLRASGTVRVSMPYSARDGSAPRVRAGARLRVTGAFRPIGEALNPGEPERRLLALQSGVVGRLGVTSAELVEPLDVADAIDIRGVTTRVVALARARAARALDLPDPDSRATTAPGRALLAAMLLGTREGGLDEVEGAFRRVGLVHLVAISGFNLAVLAQVAAFLVRLAGDRGRMESIVVALVLALYLLIVPGEAPILRAGLTVFAFALAEGLGRRYDRLTLLGWIAVALLLWRPMDLWSLGFQLSFGIVGALLWLGRHAEGRIFGVPLRGVVSVGTPIGARPGLLALWFGPGWRLFAGWFKTALSVSLLAWAVATPVIIVHTGVASPWAPLTGLVALPLTVVTLWAGYIALATGFVWPAAGAPLGDVAQWLGERLAEFVVWLDRVPGASVDVPRVSAWWGAAAVLAVLYWFGRGSWRDIRAWALTWVVLGWLGVQVYAGTHAPMGAVLRVDTLAVGDGTCHLIRSGGEAMLWDCGSSHPGFGLREIPRAVRAVGGYRVRTALVTHANIDHFICLPDVVGALGVERVFVTRALLDEAVAHPRAATAALVRELDRRGVVVLELHAGEAIELGDARCEILSPEFGREFDEANDTSFVGLFHVPTTDGERRLLMVGDLGPAGMARVRALHPGLHADAMELPHHGSAKPEAIEFVGSVDPGVVLQSTGPQRLGDHRWDGVRAGRAWRITARDGAAWMEVRADGEVRSGAFRGTRDAGE